MVVCRKAQCFPVASRECRPVPVVTPADTEAFEILGGQRNVQRQTEDLVRPLHARHFRDVGKITGRPANKCLGKPLRSATAAKSAGSKNQGELGNCSPLLETYAC